MVAAGVEVTGTEQHAAWQAREVPGVEQLADGLWSIPVPMPGPLRWVTVYAFAGPQGLVLVDAGWDGEQAWTSLTDGLAVLGATPTDVRGVLVTHLHLDHLGLAARLREESGAWVALHAADREVLARHDHRDAAAFAAGQAAFLAGLGATGEEATALVGGPERYAGFVRMALPDRLLVHGELADVPGWSLRAVHTPGHTPGHVAFHEERTGRLLAGDHVLPRITPNISLEAGAGGDPLGDYLVSLRAVRDLPVREVLPAHEWRFTGLPARVDALLAHHEHRLAELLAAVLAHPGSTPWELAGHLTWSRPWSSYDGRMRIFAVTETAAHVVQLQRRGLVRATGTPARYGPA